MEQGWPRGGTDRLSGTAGGCSHIWLEAPGVQVRLVLKGGEGSSSKSKQSVEVGWVQFVGGGLAGWDGEAGEFRRVS